MKLRLLPGRVAVRELLPLKVGRIYLPDNYHQTKENEEARTSHRAIVLDVGPPARTVKGVEIAPEFRPGDVVIFVFGLQGCEKSRASVWTDGEPCTYVAQEEVIAVEETSREAKLEELLYGQRVVDYRHVPDSVVPPRATYAAGKWTRGGSA